MARGRGREVISYLFPLLHSKKKGKEWEEGRKAVRPVYELSGDREIKRGEDGKRKEKRIFLPFSLPGRRGRKKKKGKRSRIRVLDEKKTKRGKRARRL